LIASPKKIPLKTLISGLLLLGAGWAAAYAGVVPILGVIVAAFSPD
jgi:hypothetical protein